MVWENWKKASRGEYWFARIPEHPSANKNGYVLEHRVIMENHIGRLLQRNEVIHHRNGNGKDNKIENLELMSASEHNSLHNSLRGIAMVDIICPNCALLFTRERRKTHLSNKRFTSTSCSISCRGKYSLCGLTKKEKRVIARNSIFREYRKY